MQNYTVDFSYSHCDSVKVGFAGHIVNFIKLKGNIQTGYFILFLICGSAYLVAWIIFRVLAPGRKNVEL